MTKQPKWRQVITTVYDFLYEIKDEKRDKLNSKN